MSTVNGKIEFMTKLSVLPEPEINEKKERSFKINNGTYNACVTLPEEMWLRIIEGTSKYELWVIAINGKIKSISGNDIYIEEPAVQVFESHKKPKPEEKPQQNKPQHNHNKHQHHKNKPHNQQQNKPKLEIKQI